MIYLHKSMKILVHTGLVILGLGLALLVFEGLLRIVGATPDIAPVTYDPSKFAFLPPFEKNPLTGWQLKPGKYNLIAGEGDKTISVSIKPDSSRLTREQDTPLIEGTPKILFIGDSYTFGEGLNDNETLPWHVQEMARNKNVINHSVGGYGTCQTMLRLKQLKESLSKGDMVIYGMSIFHEERNTADPRQDYWLAISSHLHQSGYPRCKLREGQVVQEESRVWTPLMPFTGRSVISRILTNAWLAILATTSQEQQRELTYALIKEMLNISLSRSAMFMVMLQDLPYDAGLDYKDFLSKNRIPFLDLTEVTSIKNLKLPDGHPGSKMTKIWAEKLDTFLSTGAPSS